MARIAIDIDTKYCGGCKSEKPHDEFHKCVTRRDGLATQCKPCSTMRGRQWYAQNKERRARMGATYYSQNRNRVIDRTYQRKYGITLDEYEQLLKEQEYVCALCKEPERAVDGRTKKVRALAVDHCHTTEQVRGLLCYHCNQLVGRLGDTIESAERLLAYLKGGGARE